jgi:hypothetical protein
MQTSQSSPARSVPSRQSAWHERAARPPRRASVDRLQAGVDAGQACSRAPSTSVRGRRSTRRDRGRSSAARVLPRRQRSAVPYARSSATIANGVRPREPARVPIGRLLGKAHKTSRDALTPVGWVDMPVGLSGHELRDHMTQPAAAARMQTTIVSRPSRKRIPATRPCQRGGAESRSGVRPISKAASAPRRRPRRRGSSLVGETGSTWRRH